ncbi:MAG TPA: hypothetical protein ENL20_06955 [Candidatus Cloacimonetes bacterium]|nr:hypothetical protein [Candidatus Cloacimonadota bacterium]
MTSFEKTFRSQTKSNLKVNFKSENLSIKIKGRNQEESDFFVKFNYKNYDEETTPEDLIKTEYDADNNILSINLTVLENEISIRNSEFVLSVPIISDVNAEVENGAISIENLQGNQKINGENGPVKMDHINGEIVCETENSPISILTSNSNIKINNENGPIMLKECEGNISLDAENSPVKVIKCKGNLLSKTENGTFRVLEANFNNADIQSENGSIYYEFTPVESGKFNFQNENGKIHLVVPDGVPYKIRAENDFGNFNIGLEGNYDRKTDNDIHIIEMIKESGNVEITAKNENGSIRIMKNPHHGKYHGMGAGFNFDLSGISDILDGVVEKIPDDINTEKIKIKIEKAKDKLKNVKIPDVSMIIENVMTGVQKEINESISKELNNEKAKETMEKVKIKIEKAMNKVQEKFTSSELSEKEKQEVDERSRLKILQMLQDGKITADEAERLLKAMEEKDYQK